MERSQRRSVILSACVVSCIALLVGLPVIGQGDDAAHVGASTGIYTEEQAAAGAEAFALHCASCHGAELQGDFGPTLAPLDRFQFSDAPLSRLFDFMRNQMPFGDPGSLDHETYLDVLAFILSENGYPSGDERLSDEDDEAFARFVLDAPPAE